MGFQFLLLSSGFMDIQFIQGMLTAKSFNSEEILSVINSLKTEGGKV